MLLKYLCVHHWPMCWMLQPPHLMALGLRLTNLHFLDIQHIFMQDGDSLSRRFCQNERGRGLSGSDEMLKVWRLRWSLDTIGLKTFHHRSQQVSSGFGNYWEKEFAFITDGSNISCSLFFFLPFASVFLSCRYRNQTLAFPFCSRVMWDETVVVWWRDGLLDILVSSLWPYKFPSIWEF